MTDLASPVLAAAPIDAAHPHYRWISLAMFAGGFATFSMLYSVQALMPLFAQTFHLSAAVASMTLSASSLTLALCMIPAGILSDRIGRKPLMLFSLVGSSFLTLLGSVSPGLETLILSRALLGVTLAGLPAVAMAYLSEELEPVALARALGLYIAGNALGGMCGRFASAWMAEHAGWRMALVMLAVVGLACSVMLWRWLPASRRFVAQPLVVGRLLGDGRRMLGDAVLPWLFVLSFLLMGCFVSLYNYLGFRLMAGPFNLSAGQIGWVFMLYVIGMFSSVGSGRSIGRFGRPTVVVAMLSLMLLGLLLTVPDVLWLVLVGMALLTFGFFCAHAALSGWVGLRAAQGRALASGIYLFAYYMGSSLLGTVSGLAWGQGAWLAVAGFLAVLLGLALLIVWRLRQQVRTTLTQVGA